MLLALSAHGNKPAASVRFEGRVVASHDLSAEIVGDTLHVVWNGKTYEQDLPGFAQDVELAVVDKDIRLSVQSLMLAEAR